MNAVDVLTLAGRDRRTRRWFLSRTAFGAPGGRALPLAVAMWLLAAVLPAMAAHFDGPFEVCEGIVFYVVNSTDQPFTIEVKGQTSAYRPMLIRVFDPDERRLARKDLPENESSDTQLRPFRFTFAARGKGVHQVHILGPHNRFDFRTYPALPFGVFGHTGGLSGHGKQFARAFVYLPPKLPSWHVSVGAYQHVMPSLTIRDETGKQRLSLSKDNLKGDVDIPESGEHLWKLAMETVGDNWYALHFGNAPIILCPDPETARAIHASTDVMPDGTLCFHKCQVRAWQLLQKYRKMPASAFEVALPDLNQYKAEWIKDPVRNGYLSGLYRALPPALKEQNLNPASPWFGTFRVWHDEKAKNVELPGNPFADYSRRGLNDLIKWAGPLACAFAVNQPFNPLYRNEALRKRILIGALQDILLMKESERRDTPNSLFYGDRQIYFANVPDLFAYTVRDCPPDERAIWTEGMERMTDSFAIAHSSCVNQWAFSIRGIATMSLGSDDPWYRKLVSRHVRWIVNRSLFGCGQAPAGYHQEGAGPDAYNGFTCSHLAYAYRVTGDPLILESVRRCYEMFDHTIAAEPDGRHLSANSFSFRTPWGWGNAFSDCGYPLLAELLPQAGMRAGKYFNFAKPANTESEIREAVGRMRPEKQWRFMAEDAKWDGGFGCFDLYQYFSRKPLSGQLPAVSDKPFVKAFGDEFFFARRPAYYAGFYAGNHDVKGSWSSPLVQGPHSGGLLLFWSPGFGSSVLGMNWNAYSVNALVATAANGKTEWESFKSVRGILKQNPDRLLISGEIYNLPLQFSREYEFLNDRLGVTLTLKATAPVRLTSFVECFPYPVGKTKPNAINVQTADGSTLDENGRDTASVFLRNDSNESHVLVFAEPRRCRAVVVESVDHYDARRRVGSVQVGIPLDWAAGQERVFRYALVPTAAPGKRVGPTSLPATVAPTPALRNVRPTITTSVASGDGAINLLPRIDPQKDAVHGEWRIEGSDLLSDKEKTYTRIEIPYRPPAEYDLRVTFTRLGGTDSPNVILAQPGRQFMWHMDTFNNHMFGFSLIDGVLPPENATGVKRPNGLVNGRRYKTIIQVRNDQLKVYLDDELIVQWSGDMKRLSLAPACKLHNDDTLGLLTWSCPVAFHKLELLEVTGKGTFTRTALENAGGTSAPQSAPPLSRGTGVAPAFPAQTSSAGAINLLALVNPRRDAVQGHWKLAADGVTLEKPDAAGVLDLPYAPPEEYDFEVEFTPSSGNNSVNQYLAAAGRSFAWKLNAYGEKPPLYCMDLLDGKSAEYRDDASAQKPLTLEAGRRYTSKVEVRRGSLRALVNGEEYLRWSGDFNRLSLEPHYKLHDSRHIGVGSFQRGVTFHRIEVREVSGKVTLTLAGQKP
ncbi:MAG: hypothetical protein NTY01_21500 [Verrucomicrobia bacterium]|nr:hypothetical protein [Verrucomicrobiota bacterium]